MANLVEIQKEYLWSEEKRLDIEEKLILARLSVEMKQNLPARDSIITANAGVLLDIAARDSTRNSVLASVLLHSAGIIEYEAEVVLPQLDAGAKSLEFEDIIFEEDDTDILEEPVPQFKVYPNPNDGSMWLAYDIESAGKVVIYSMSGAEIASYDLDPENKFYLIKNHNLESGTYIYRIISNGKVVHTDKYTVMRY